MVFYFLKRLYLFLVCLFFGIICILSLGDLLVRLTLLPSLGAIPVILMLMFPLLSIFAIPLATSLGTHILAGALCDNNEILLVHFLPRLKKALFWSVFIFSLSIMIIYVPLVCEWAPRSYFRGKKYMVTLVQERLLQLEPGRFHTFLSKLSLYFQDKKSTQNGIVFENIIIKSGAKGRPFIIVSQKGSFEGNIFKLHNGTILSVDNQKQYVVSFEETEISIDTFWSTQGGDDYLGVKDPKYMHWSEIKKKKESGDRGALVEFHVRIARILWQFLFPFIALMVMLSFCQVGGNSLFLSFSSSLVIMLVAYINVSMAQIVNSEYLFFTLLYGVMLGCVSLVVYLYKKRET
jgi:lipopolysaccharide export LptBFGC system permease protein LptF